jgi:hypothetical protein
MTCDVAAMMNCKCNWMGLPWSSQASYSHPYGGAAAGCMSEWYVSTEWLLTICIWNADYMSVTAVVMLRSLTAAGRRARLDY